MTVERQPGGVDRQLRGRGMFLGVAVGDALGWPQEQRSSIVGGARSRNVAAKGEFREWRRNSGTQFGRYVETVQAGEYSDDTQLMLAVARACRSGDSWLEHLTRVELPAWVSYQRGGGRAVLMAARAWLRGHAPWIEGSKQVDPSRYLAAGANGVAMRIAPHALVAVDLPAEQLLARVIADGITTHGHPRALMGGALHALTLRFLLRQSSTLGYGELVEQLRDEASWRRLDLAAMVPQEWLAEYRMRTKQSAQEAWDATVVEVDRMLDLVEDSLRRGALADEQATLAGLGCFDPKVNGSGTVTALAALYLVARSAARPMSGLLGAAFLKNADTDTLASMVASSLGALHGPDWMGLLSAGVQDSAYIASLQLQMGKPLVPAQPSLFSNPVAAGPSMARVTNNDMTRFARVLDEGEARDGTFVDGRRFIIDEHVQLESRVRASVSRFRLRLEDGQTIIIDRARKGPSAEPKPTTSRGDSAATAFSRIRRVTLFVRDLELMADFYRNDLGLDVRDHGSEAVDVGESLRLRRDPTAPRGPRGMVVELEVSANSPAVGSIRGRRQLGEDFVELDDPEGNRVMVFLPRD